MHSVCILPPLIIGVDIPDGSLGKDLVFVQGYTHTHTQIQYSDEMMIIII